MRLFFFLAVQYKFPGEQRTSACSPSSHFYLLAYPVLAHTYIQPRLELARPPRSDLHSAHERLRREREPTCLMHNGKFALRRKRERQHAMRETLLKTSRIEQHARFLPTSLTLPLRGPVKSKRETEGRVVHRERDGCAHVRRVHCYLARAEHFDVWTAEVAKGGGAGEAGAVEETAGVR